MKTVYESPSMKAIALAAQAPIAVSPSGTIENYDYQEPEIV